MIVDLKNHLMTIVTVSLNIWLCISQWSWTCQDSPYHSRKCAICQSRNSKWSDSHHEQCGYWKNRKRGGIQLL